MKSPYISVIVPVYNREKLLERCLDTLVYQTLEEIEIIIVDDFSTDASYQIAQEYQRNFPQKIKVIKNETKGVAYAKNLGITHACGEYLTFVDSDDYIEYWALEEMYGYAKKNHYEMVCAPMYRIQKGKKAVWGRIGNLSMVKILFSEIFSLCTKLIHRQIFERFGMLPELRIGEDAAFLYSVISYLENKIGYYDRPYYYYEWSENSVTSEAISFEIIEDILKGGTYILKQGNPEYLNVLKCVVLRRTLNMMERYPEYKDQFIDYIAAHKELYTSNLYLSEKCLQIKKRLDKVLVCTQFQIPHRIYVNAFEGIPNPLYLEMLHTKAFRSGAKVILLSEKNCDIKENTFLLEAYQKQLFSLVGSYFVLKHIYEEGGFYISEKIQLEHPLDQLSYTPAFFSYLDHEHFSEDIYGAERGNCVIGELLETFQMKYLYKNPYESLAQRIKTVLIVSAGVHLFACTRELWERGVVVYEPSLLIQMFHKNPNLCHLKFTLEEGTELIRTDTLNCMLDEMTHKTVKEKDTSQDRLLQEVMKEKEELLNSTCWKITKPVRKLGDFVYRLRYRT